MEFRREIMHRLANRFMTKGAFSVIVPSLFAAVAEFGLVLARPEHMSIAALLGRWASCAAGESLYSEGINWGEVG